MRGTHSLACTGANAGTDSADLSSARQSASRLETGLRATLRSTASSTHRSDSPPAPSRSAHPAQPSPGPSTAVRPRLDRSGTTVSAWRRVLLDRCPLVPARYRPHGAKISVRSATDPSHVKRCAGGRCHLCVRCWTFDAQVAGGGCRSSLKGVTPVSRGDLMSLRVGRRFRRVGWRVVAWAAALSDLGSSLIAPAEAQTDPAPPARPTAAAPAPPQPDPGTPQVPEALSIESWTPSTHTTSDGESTTMEVFAQPAFTRSADGGSRSTRQSPWARSSGPPRPSGSPTRSRPVAGPRTVHWVHQEKHTPGRRSFMLGRSALTASPGIFLQRAGAGASVGDVPRGYAGFRERRDFGNDVGTYTPEVRTSGPTMVGILCYRASGSTHTVPGRFQ